MKTIRVAAAVILRNSAVFVTQRGYGPWKDWWGFPGGKIEEGETPREPLPGKSARNWTRRLTSGKS